MFQVRSRVNGNGEAANGKNQEGGPGDDRRKCAGGQRAQTFARMGTVAFDVDQIVHQVDRARHQAKEKKGDQDAANRVQFRQPQFAVEEQGGEDEAVFGPLAGPHGF